MIRATEALLAAAFLLAAGSAAAQDPSPPPEATDARAQARSHYLAGVGLAERAAWSEAYAEFARAQELFPAPSNLYNLGQCERALGRYVGALATFREFLATANGPEHEPLRKTAEGYIAELGGRVVKLRVAATPGDAAIAVDGKAAHGELILDPGHHTVRVEHAGYTTAFVDRDLRPGDDQTVRVDLERLPAHLSVRADVAAATVWIDGAVAGSSPWKGDRVAGVHHVQIRAKGYVTYESQLNVAAGQSGELDAKLVKESVSLAKRWWFWTLLGGVAAGVAVTTYAATRDTPPADYQGGSLGWVVRK